MSRYTITPWRTQADLLQVRTQLYSSDGSDTETRRRAVDRVMAWKLRGNLPHAVESTALLVEAILHHDIQTNSIFSIRAVYSAAFTRFVTGFCDIGRHKERTLEPSSMLDIAKQIGMPVEFVALRHEATHEELPGIPRLVSAAQQALEWLWKVYWSRLEEPDDDEAIKASLASMKMEAATILRDFRRSRRDALRSKTQPSAAHSGEVAATSDRCVEMCKGIRARTEALAGVMIQERLMLPSKRELGSPLDGAYLIWDELLVSISPKLPGFLPALVEFLLQSLTARTAMDPASDADKEALAMWLLHALDGDDFTTAASCDQDTLFADVMKWCCLHPGHWTHHIGRELLERGGEDLQAEWGDLFEASLIGAKADGIEETMPGAGLSEVRDVPSERVSDEDEVRSVGGWSRAVVPPLVPIGVVQ